MSTPTAAPPATAEQGSSGGGGGTAPPKKHRGSASKNVEANGAAGAPSDAQKQSTASSRTLSNGSAHDFEYFSDPFDLEEPFSESDDESAGPKKTAGQLPAKPRLQLPLPRGRIRTLSGTVPPVGYAPVWGGPTMCLECMEFFDLPRQVDQFGVHLLDKHKVVISEIQQIVDLKRYVEHWRQRFAKEPLEKLFPKVEPAADHELYGRTPHYYLISDASSTEDRTLRERLAMRRLEEVLLCQQRERDDRFFSQQCLFCRYTARGNRAKLIHHLYMVHHLNLGSPDNLVFVAEYLDTLRERLVRNECLYCEKSYGDRPALMEHMRKRAHREVNPSNSYYDKFYIINYLELGKKWLDVLAEDFEDQMPHFVDSDEEAENESWHEWLQDGAEPEEERTAMCLFCAESDTGVHELLAHVKEEHGFDVVHMFDQHGMQFYERIKFINYIRKKTYECVCPVCGAQSHNAAELRKHMAKAHTSGYKPKRKDWDKEEYLVPMFDNDHLLWMLESHLEARSGRTRAGSESLHHGAPTSDALLHQHQGADVGPGGGGGGGKPRSYSTAAVAGHAAMYKPSRAAIRQPVLHEPSASSSAGGHRAHLASVTECSVEPADPGAPVVAEDMPDLCDSAVDDEMLEGLK